MAFSVRRQLEAPQKSLQTTWRSIRSFHSSHKALQLAHNQPKIGKRSRDFRLILQTYKRNLRSKRVRRKAGQLLLETANDGLETWNHLHGWRALARAKIVCRSTASKRWFWKDENGNFHRERVEGNFADFGERRR